MIISLVFIHIASAFSRLDIAISQETNQLLLSELTNSIQIYYMNLTELNLVSLKPEDPIDDSVKDSNILIDATFNLILQVKLTRAAKEFGFIHIIIGEPFKKEMEWDYFSLLPEKAHYEALKSLLVYLKWYQYNLIYSDLAESIKLSEFFQGEAEKKQEFCYPNDKSQDVTNNFIGKEVKTTGLQNIVILNEGEGTKKLIWSLISNKMYVKNAGVLLWSKSIWGSKQDGLLIVVQEGLEFAESAEEYEVASVLHILQKIDASSTSKFSIKNSLDTKLRDHHSFTIVNTQNGQRVIIGTILNGNLTLFQNPLFPGQTYDYPDSENSKLTISVSDGNSNYDGIVHNGNWIVRVSAIYAIKYAIEINLIQNFNIIIHDSDCSAEYYEHNFSYNCLLKQNDEFGVVFIASLHDDVCFGTINDFREMGVKIPVLGDLCIDPKLNDQSQYPEFVRVVKGFELHSSTMARMMGIFGWKNIVIIYENSTFGKTLYGGFMNVANKNGIKVLNDEDKRMIKAGYSNSDFEEYKGQLTHAVQTNGRIFALFVFIDLSSYFYITGHLYDLGLRRGDAIFLCYETVSWFGTYAIGLEQDVIDKCKNLYFGSLTFFQAEWIGDLGKLAYNGIQEYWNRPPLSFQCLSFNTGWIVVNALNSLIQFGDDYTDRDTFLKAVRRQKIISCTGKLVMSPYTNEPEEMIVGINNLIPNSTTGVWRDIPVGSYSIVRNPVLTFDQTIIFPDGGTIPPSDIRVDSINCPFTSRQVQNSDSGKTAYFSLVSFWTVIALGISSFALKKSWNLSFPVITDKKEIKFQDYIVIICILIETVQLLALGPCFFYSEMSDPFYFISGNLANSEKYDSKIFWPGINAAFAISAAVLVSNILILCKADKKIMWGFIVFICEISRELLPHISNLLFIPVINSMFSVFRCTKGTSSSLYDSFLYGDCNYSCWQSWHLTVAIIASIALLFFIPITIIFRPYYEILSSEKNIYCNQHYCIAKSILQTIAIALNATLGKYSKSLHGLIYILLLILSLIYTLIKKPYNYNRTNLWAIFSILAVTWNVILSSIYFLMNDASIIIWSSILIGGWICLIIFGYIFEEKYYPNLLFSVPGKDISLFFKFEFSTRISPSEISESMKHKYSMVDSKSKLNSPKGFSDESLDFNNGI